MSVYFLASSSAMPAMVRHEAVAAELLTVSGWLVFVPRSGGLEPHRPLLDALKLLHVEREPEDSGLARYARHAMVPREELAAAELLVHGGCLVIPPVAVLAAAFFGLREVSDALAATASVFEGFAPRGVLPVSRETSAQRFPLAVAEHLDEIYGSLAESKSRAERAERQRQSEQHVLPDELVDALVGGMSVDAQNPLQLGTVARALGLTSPTLFELGILAGSLMRRGLKPLLERGASLTPEGAMRVVFLRRCEAPPPSCETTPNPKNDGGDAEGGP